MKKPRVKISRLSAVRARRFGALSVKPMLGAKGHPMSALHISMKPHSEAPELYHAKTDEYFYILRGSSSGTVNGRKRRFRAGDFCFLPSGTLHHFRAGPKGVELIDVFVPRLDLASPDIIVKK